MKQNDINGMELEDNIGEKYIQWMKIAADNKINSSNSWSLPLIDYFYDISYMKDGKDEINFQKASCTLDGCIKIYSSRIDSVLSETNQLVIGLIEGDSKKKSGKNTIAEEDDENHGRSAKNATRINNSGNTNLADEASLNLKKLELEVSMDPVFTMISTNLNLDGKGKSSLLLSTLKLNASAQVLFGGSSIGCGWADGETVTCETEEEKSCLSDLINEKFPGLTNHSLPNLLNLNEFYEDKISSMKAEQHLDLMDDYDFKDEVDAFAEDEVINDEDSVAAINVVLDVKESTFYSYFDSVNKFPGYWKIEKKKCDRQNTVKKSSRKQQQEIFFIDFSQEINCDYYLTRTKKKKKSFPDRKNALLERKSYYSFKNLSSLFSKNISYINTGGIFGDSTGNDSRIIGPEEDEEYSIRNDMQECPEESIDQKRIDKIDYAKVQKRVDIRHLKDLMWDKLRKRQKSSFKQTISHVLDFYPEEQRKDLSCSLFFISLLHLANEEDLEIEKVESDLIIQKCAA